MTAEDLIEEVGRRLTAAAPDADIILFGLRAHGEARPDSDLDLLVIEPDFDRRGEEYGRLRKELRGPDRRCRCATTNYSTRSLLSATRLSLWSTSGCRPSKQVRRANSRQPTVKARTPAPRKRCGEGQRCCGGPDGAGDGGGAS